MPDIKDFEDYREFLVIYIVVELGSLEYIEIKCN